MSGLGSAAGTAVINDWSKISPKRMFKTVGGVGLGAGAFFGGYRYLKGKSKINKITKRVNDDGMNEKTDNIIEKRSQLTGPEEKELYLLRENKDLMTPENKKRIADLLRKVSTYNRLCGDQSSGYVKTAAGGFITKGPQGLKNFRNLLKNKNLRPTKDISKKKSIVKNDMGKVNTGVPNHPKVNNLDNLLEKTERTNMKNKFLNTSGDKSRHGAPRDSGLLPSDIGFTN